jgi:hydantoinase/carbamoylase family amidase
MNRTGTAMHSLPVLIRRIQERFEKLERIGNLGTRREDGFDRPAWSDAESAAMKYIQGAAEKAGMVSTWDGVGNLFLTTPGHGEEFVQVGSHIDTVPSGGNYDGAAGIVCGLEAIIPLKPMWERLNRKLQLVLWRGEESASFNAVCKGSGAAFGVCNPDILKNTNHGMSLHAAIQAQGFDPSFIAEKKATLSPEQKKKIASYIELHIEQAKRLETDGIPIGVVSSIRGTVRLRVEVSGEANHSGGTPMGIRYRKDANLAIAYMQVGIHEACSYAIEKGSDLVQTAGIINTDGDFNKKHPLVHTNSLTKVSPYGYFALDIRSNNTAFLTDYVKDIKKIIQERAKRFNVEVKITEILRLAPVERLDPAIQHSIEASCRDLKIPFIEMPSGAIHDAALVAGQGIPVGMIFIPCRGGISHNPAEYASPEDLARGSQILSNVLYRLAR